MANEQDVYVVTRDGRRVSFTNHETRAQALVEAKWWTALINKEIHGRKVDPRSIIRIIRTDNPKRIK
jgi:hypothetical protein